jgi:hypothetical protein
MKTITTILFTVISCCYCIFTFTDIQATEVIPPEYTSTTGTATFTGPLANTPRTYQLLIQNTQLTALVGENITAISWRLPAGATSNWPAADVSIASYDIYLSASVEPINRSLTFINNIVGPQRLVRSGILNITDSTYRFGGSPNEFGPEITFDSAYLYTGGNLLIELRHTGFTGTTRTVDAIGTSISGYGTLFSACWGSGYTATSGSQGNFSVIKISSDSTLVSIGESNQIPAEFTLSQNYPNPFNPVTKINFNIPSAEFVTLSVYDVMGREVAVLINESLKPGSYEAEWNAVNSTSNIYFYKLTAGNFTETKSMILIK